VKFGKISNIAPVVADGAIAHPSINSGKITPVLVIDCKNVAALIDLCHIHRSTPPGDVESIWFWNLPDFQHVYLRITFSKPVQVTANIKFDVKRQGGLVHGILTSHAFYLQPSAFGASASEGLGKSNILVEVPRHVTPPKWNTVWEHQLTKRYRKAGHDRKQAKEAAKQYMMRARETWLIQTPHISREQSDAAAGTGT